jgi:hypothetical protein
MCSENDNFRAHFKERPANETVSLLKSLLQELGIEVVEKWQSESSLGT